MSYNIRVRRFNRVAATALTECAVLMEPVGASSRLHPVIACHASGQDSMCAYDHAYYAATYEALAAAGYVVLIPDLGTAALPAWNNTASMTRVTEALAWLTANTRADTSKVHLEGISMGGGTAYLWASQNPTLVKSITGRIPAIALVDLHDNNRGPGSEAAIDAAYTNHAGYVAATPANHDASQQTAAILSAGIPCQNFYATNDPFTPLSVINAFNTAVNATATSLGAVAHDAHTVDQAQLVAFVQAHEA